MHLTSSSSSISVVKENKIGNNREEVKELMRNEMFKRKVNNQTSKEEIQIKEGRSNNVINRGRKRLIAELG